MTILGSAELVCGLLVRTKFALDETADEIRGPWLERQLTSGRHLKEKRRARFRARRAILFSRNDG
jgi:hypothetical protein